MASITIQPGNATLSAWVIAMRNAAEAGTAPHQFAEVRPSHITKAARSRDIPLQDGRIHTDHVANLYFACCDVLGVERRIS